jgi:large subunit ribosomal protein L10
MQKEDKVRVVEELTERLRSADTLIVADYRGLTMPQIDALRGRLLEHGARFSVVKNTLTRRAAEAAGAEKLLALLEGPTAIAFIEADGDMVAVAKALADSARETRVLAIRGGILAGREITAGDVEELSSLPPLEVLRGQVIGAVIAPLTQLLALVAAPLQNLHGLIDARIEQLGGAEGAEAAPAGAEPAAAADEPAAEGEPEQAAAEAEAVPAAAAAETDEPAPAAEAETEQPAAEAETEPPAVEAGTETPETDETQEAENDGGS